MQVRFGRGRLEKCPATGNSLAAYLTPTEARCLMTVPFSSVVPCVSEDYVPCNGGLPSVHAVLQGLLDSELKRVSDGVAKARA